MTLPRYRTALTTLLCAALGACSSDHKAPSSGFDPNGVGGSGGTTSGGGDGGQDTTEPDASSSPGPSTDQDAGPDGGPLLGTIPGDIVPTVREGGGPPGDPQCDPANTWSSSATIAELAGTTQTLLAASHDELTIVWTEGPTDGKTLHVADRSNAMDAFGTPQQVNVPEGYDLNLGVALTPDGLQLALIQAEGRGFAEIVRDARGDAFDPMLEPDASVLSEGPFVQLRLWAEPTGRRFAFPVIGSEDDTMYYSWFRTVLDEVSTADVAVATFGNTSWIQDETVLEPTVMQRNDGTRLLPTGISADELTLFFWDEGDSAEKAVWRVSTAYEPFDSVVSLGDFEGATPNADCSRLYFSRGGVLRVAEAD